MSEAPTGLLEWGQAGIYNAVQDREVIRAVTRMRTGLVWPAVITAGAGLNITVQGGWLGIADCGDRTSAVVGSRLDQVVQAVPGPGSGERRDLIWCDIEPDDAVWRLNVIPEAAAVGRPGIPLAFLTVPGGASLASQIGIRPADSTLERRLIAYAARNDTRTASGQTWGSADTVCWTENSITEPGQWYRVKFEALSVTPRTGTLDLKIGVGWHALGTSDNTTVLMRAASIACVRLGAAHFASVEYVFRHPVDAAPSARHWDGRIWAVGSGTYSPTGVTSVVGGNPGPQLSITVEDIGS
jgi:hypothetical protein